MLTFGKNKGLLYRISKSCSLGVKRFLDKNIFVRVIAICVFIFAFVGEKNVWGQTGAEAGNDGSTTSFTTLDDDYDILGRKWYAQVTNSVPTESFQFDLSSTTLGNACLLGVLVADDASFTQNLRFVSGTLNGSTLTVNDVQISNGKYFTVATNNNPVAICKDTTVYLDNTGNVTITPEMVDDGSYGCGNINRTVSPQTLDCEDVSPKKDFKSYSQIVYSDGNDYNVVIKISDLVLNVTSRDCYPLNDAITFSINFHYEIEINGTYNNDAITDLHVYFDFGGTLVQAQLPNSASSGNKETNSTYFSQCNCNANSIDELTCGEINPYISIEAIGQGDITKSNYQLENVSKQVTLTITDQAGNSSSCTANVTVLDTIKPIINCPAITTTVDAGQDSATINLDTVTIAAADTTDNCCIDTVYHEKIANNKFGKGTTPVKWYIEDCSGNKNSCTQTITVTRPLFDVTIKDSTLDCNAASGEINYPVNSDVTSQVVFVVDTFGVNWDSNHMWGFSFKLDSTNVTQIDSITCNAPLTADGFGTFSVSNIEAGDNATINVYVTGKAVLEQTVTLSITSATDETNNSTNSTKTLDGANWDATSVLYPIPGTGDITTE